MLVLQIVSDHEYIPDDIMTQFAELEDTTEEITFDPDSITEALQGVYLETFETTEIMLREMNAKFHESLAEYLSTGTDGISTPLQDALLPLSSGTYSDIHRTEVDRSGMSVLCPSFVADSDCMG
ncbi:hypothetical protein ADUPG1_009969, partial [Aduncisulcus paluster]